MLAKLADDKSLDTFRKEFEKLHRALHKSHESERRLMSKCRELNAEIVANTARVATALKLSGEDQATIEALRKEVDKAWKTLDVAQERENKGKETIESLRTEIDSLTREIQHGAGKSAGLENRCSTPYVLIIRAKAASLFHLYNKRAELRFQLSLF